MLIVVYIILAGLLGAAPALYERAARKRFAVRERERYDRIIDEQAALHRAIADKLIPRFAVNGPPEGDETM